MPDNPTNAYRAAMREADQLLDEALGHIRAEEAAGRITPREAADERVELLERHLAEVRRLRNDLLGT